MATKRRRAWGVTVGIACRAIAARLDRELFSARGTQLAIPVEEYLNSQQRHLPVTPNAQTGLGEPRPGFNLHSL